MLLILRSAQFDRIVITLVLTALVPMLLHALPTTFTAGLGQVWLPIFYAPLIAALCFRPHVALIAGLCGPSINNLLFGMPAGGFVLPLTFTLALFSAGLLLIRRRVQPAGWMAALAYTGALLFTRLIFAQGAPAEMAQAFLRSIAIALPGIVVLAVLAEIIRRSNLGHDA